MSIVTLVSGGLDSTVMAILAQEEGLEQFPLFIDYGQLNLGRESAAWSDGFRRWGLPEPRVADISGYGGLISSGLTDPDKRVYEDAFLPGRNLMFLTVGAAYAVQVGAGSVAIGLLNDAYRLFSDQSHEFLEEAEYLLTRSMGQSITVIAPLMSMSKAEIVAIAKDKGISGTYSCHAGTDPPCGECVACREYLGLEV